MRLRWTLVMISSVVNFQMKGLGCWFQWIEREHLWPGVADAQVGGSLDPVGVVAGSFDDAGVAAGSTWRVEVAAGGEFGVDSRGRGGPVVRGERPPSRWRCVG